MAHLLVRSANGMLKGPPCMQTRGFICPYHLLEENCLQDRKAAQGLISKAARHKAPSQGRAWAATCSPGQLWAGCEAPHPSLTSPALSNLSRAGSSPKVGTRVWKIATHSLLAAKQQAPGSSLLTGRGSAVSPPSCWKSLPQGITDLKRHY